MSNQTPISTTDLMNLVKAMESYQYDPEFHQVQYKATQVLKEYLNQRGPAPEPQILIIFELIPEELRFYLIPETVAESFGVLSDLHACNGVTVNVGEDQEKVDIFMDNIYPLFENAWEEYRVLDSSTVFGNIHAVFNFGFYL